MTATLADYFDDFVLPTQQPKKRPKKSLLLRDFPADKDIMLWLTSNEPNEWQELQDLRYSLYHRCSRAGFKIKKETRDYFTLTGDAGSVVIVSNKARHFLLWQLRMLAREMGWVGRYHRKPRRKVHVTV